jgi:hypothetical protein
MGDVIKGKFKEMKRSPEEQIKEIFEEAAIEFIKLAKIISDNGGGDVPLPLGVIITEELLERYYHEDYTPLEVYERTSGFQDPPPPKFVDVELFLQGKKEL